MTSSIEVLDEVSVITEDKRNVYKLQKNFHGREDRNGKKKEVIVIKSLSTLKRLFLTSHEFFDFVLRHELVTYLTLIPSFILTVISLSLTTVGIFVFQIILILVGSFVMFKKHTLEKSVEFTKKLGVFVEEFEDKMTDPAYICSLPSIALEVARSEKTLKRTQAWDKLLTKLSEDLTNKIYMLDERIKKSDGKDFPSLLVDFCHVLGLIREFKKKFYKMVEEYGKTNFARDFGQDKRFYNRFERLSKQYNSYMNRLIIFSDELRAEIGGKFDDKLFEYICSAKELFRTK